MAYQINRFNQTLLTVLDDGTIDRSTDLKFVGKNYAGYGEIHNENFLFLLENFSNDTAPPNRIKGQIWFDSSVSKLKFYDGTSWRTAGGAEVTDERPGNLTEGDFWWDAANDQLFAFNGSDFILVGPQNVGEGITGTQDRTVLDTSNTAREIVASVINGKTVAVFSDEEFEILNTPNNIIEGFDRVKRGVTLINTNANGVTTTDHFFWGTASNSQRLGGLEASDFVTQGSASFNTRVEFTDNGFTLGDSGDLRVYVPDGTDNKIAIENQIGNNIFFGVKDGQTVTNTFRITGDNILPGITNLLDDPKAYVDRDIDIGSSSRPFQTVYADRFEGTTTVAQTMEDQDGIQRSLSKQAVENTIALRDASGDLRANLFVGTALTAKYADLAEKYTTESALPVGTVVSVCAHQDHEMCAANTGDVVTGVVSENPAYLMNSEQQGQAVALVGRVPVRTVGAVKKGDRLFARNGTAVTDSSVSFIGIALESSDIDAEKLIEVYLKV